MGLSYADPSYVNLWYVGLSFIDWSDVSSYSLDRRNSESSTADPTNLDLSWKFIFAQDESRKNGSLRCCLSLDGCTRCSYSSRVYFNIRDRKLQK